MTSLLPTKGKVFLDTNILVYQFDHTHPAKQKMAQQLVAEALLGERAVISSQVIQEFMNVAVGKFSTKLSSDELRLVMANVLQPLWAHVPSYEFYERALGLQTANSLSFYDALIVQAAIDLGCTLLYSEDLQAGQQFGSLVIQNPF